MPLPNGGTLDDYRMMHSNYDTGGSFSAKAMRPALIIAVAIGAAFVGMNYYSDRGAATTDTAVVAPALSVPSPAFVPTPTEMPAVTAPAAIEPMSSPIKQTELSSLPPAGQSKNSSSELTKPVKAKSSVAAKAPSPTAKKITPIPVEPLIEFTPLKQEAPPSSAPATIPEVAPPVPAPAPDVPPVEPPKL
jgi:hypothetical protein